jgi:hypothetical protein
VSGCKGGGSAAGFERIELPDASARRRRPRTSVVPRAFKVVGSGFELNLQSASAAYLAMRDSFLIVRRTL